MYTRSHRIPRAKALSLAVAASLAAVAPLTAKAQTISTTQTGPVNATSNTDITISGSGSVSGGRYGISVGSGISFGNLTNNGTISGTNTGVYNSGTIGTLNNNALILGGGSTAIGVHTGTIGTLINSGTITNGDIWIESGTITSLINSGLIKGSSSWVGINNGGAIGTLTNNDGGTISGGQGGINNNGTIGTLTNSAGGTIAGGQTGIINSGGTIGTVVNSGLITGARYALYNPAESVLGTVTNSGTIAGNIANLSSADLNINGGAGSTFGTLTGYGGAVGTIANTASNVVFGSGNLLLHDNINVGSHSVNNMGATLQVNAPMTITGNYSQGAGATLLSGVTSATNYGQLVVSGNASIAAESSVGLKSLGYAFAPGQRFVVVDAAGTGSYNENSLHYSATGYSGTIVGQNVSVGGRSDLVLCLESCSATPSSGPAARMPATAPNSVSSIGGALGYSGYNPDLMNLQNAVIAMNAVGSTAVANRVGAQLAPVHSSAGMQAAAAPTFGVLAVVAAHADSLRLAQAEGAGGTESGIATGESAPPWGVWGQGFGGHAGQGAVGQVDGYSANYGGLLFGLDRRLNDRWRAGAVFSYSNTLINGTENSAGQSTRVNGYGLMGYASYTGASWYVNLSAGAVQQRYDTTRQIDFTGFSGVANGQFNGQQYVASVEGGYPLAVGGFTVTPLGSVTYSYQHQDSYTESGGNGAALSVGPSHGMSVRTALGAKLERGFETRYGMIVPDLQLKWIHEYDHTKVATNASFAADPTGQTAFTTVGQAPVSDLAAMSLGVTVLRANNLTVTARYELQAAPRFVSQTGSLRLRQLF
ncbi:Outer membrane autotransporter barrel domain protein [Burkholderia multivorans]